MSVAVHRKYALTRLGPGDYLLPSNDAKTLWRITRYEEDGSAEVSPDGKKWHRVRGQFWQTWKYKLPVDLDAPVNTDYEAWESWAAMFPTRRGAVADVLR